MRHLWPRVSPDGFGAALGMRALPRLPLDTKGHRSYVASLRRAGSGIRTVCRTDHRYLW